MPKFNLGRYIKTFPKKHHVEYITAILSIPVLLSVIALNLLNLQNNSNKNEPQPTPTAEKPIIVQVTGASQNNPPSITPTDKPFCKKEVGPVSITSPEEDETVTEAPVCFTIRYGDENYCSVVWSYRINGGAWSDYSSTSPCFYSLPDGDIKFELRVQSTVSQDTQVIERNFKYAGPSATPSANPEGI